MCHTENSNALLNSFYDEFVKDIIGKVFKILPIWEDCESNKNFDNFNIYLDKIVTMFMGSDYLYNNENFYLATSTLKGMQMRGNLSQKKVKSLVFHCIDLLEKSRQEEG